MIHTNELMLGNWVEYATGLNNDKRSIPMYVTAIFDDEVYLDFPGNEGDPFEVRDEDLLGIPITEELLEKCWFVYNESYKCYIFDGIRVGEHKCRDKFYVSNGLYGTAYINFLHELQNAYFMLTREHFEVKL